MHPFHEEGVAAFQDTVRHILSEHAECEKKAGRRIEPAKRKEVQCTGNDEVEAAILGCAKLHTRDFSW